jgi:acetoacetyl-CoA synthetase
VATSNYTPISTTLTDVTRPAQIRVASSAWRRSPQACHACVRDVCLDDGAPPLPGAAIHGLPRLVASPAPDGFERFPFNHPLFVLFSSGTTVAPKCILQGAGGTLLEHPKEHHLHCDLGPSDRLFFQTSAAWMMWNWQLSGLATGAAIVLYDGPVTGPETLWEIVADRRGARFGTSPTYLALCQDRLRARQGARPRFPCAA